MSDVVRGQKAIAEVLRVSIATVKRWERRPSDPLRLWSSEHDPSPWALRSRLVAYRQRRLGDLEQPRTEGWVAIAALLGVSVDLAQDLAARPRDPLPVTRGSRVWAHTHALLDWLDGQHRPHVLAGGPTTREDVCPPGPAAKARRLAEQSAEPGATATARVGVAHVPEEYRSQDESAASSSAPRRPVSRGSRRLLSVSRRYDGSGMRRAAGAS